MKTTPFICNSFEVRGILAGNKTMARRVVKGKTEHIAQMRMVNGNAVSYVRGAGAQLWEDVTFKCPYGSIGDVLWVRETWFEADGKYYYKADDPRYRSKPSTQMPKTACRIWLEIMNIKVERLRQITNEDAIAEGVEKHAHGYKKYTQHTPSHAAVYDVCIREAKSSFETLWQSINGEQSWNDNPWVWVIEFKRIDKPIFIK